MKRSNRRMRKTPAVLNRKGASLVEVVVTLALIAIVIAVASSITLSSVTAQTNARLQAQASECVYNVIECFRYADSEDDFTSALQAAYGEVAAPSSDSDEANTFAFTFDNVDVVVKLSYPENSTDFTQSSVSVTAAYGGGKTETGSFSK